MKTWVIVASAARARIFETAGRRMPLRELSDLINPEDRLHPRDLKSDKPGRAFDTLGGQRHAMQTPVEPKEQTAIRFAKQVVETLESGINEGRFDTLCLVAPPHFLGLVREHMSDALSRAIAGDVVKDLTKEEIASIEEHVAHLLKR